MEFIDQTVSVRALIFGALIVILLIPLAAGSLRYSMRWYRSAMIYRNTWRQYLDEVDRVRRSQTSAERLIPGFTGMPSAAEWSKKIAAHGS